jgi:transposase
MKGVREFSNVFIHREPVDMRRGINGLCEIVACSEMGDLRGRNLFVFCGKKKSLIKVLYFDKSGFALWQKKLERERFAWPKKLSEPVVSLTAEQFEWLLEGYDVWKMRGFSQLNFEKVI